MPPSLQEGPSPATDMSGGSCLARAPTQPAVKLTAAAARKRKERGRRDSDSDCTSNSCAYVIGLDVNKYYRSLISI